MCNIWHFPPPFSHCATPDLSSLPLLRSCIKFRCCSFCYSPLNCFKIIKHNTNSHNRICAYKSWCPKWTFSMGHATSTLWSRGNSLLKSHPWQQIGALTTPVQITSTPLWSMEGARDPNMVNKNMKKVPSKEDGCAPMPQTYRMLTARMVNGRL